MKPCEIKGLLNLARRARQKGKVFNPLFVSPPGIGKSEIVKQWAMENNLPLIDLRAAYLEAPEVIGYPIVQNTDGKQKMHYATPDTWPETGEGVIFIDEVNRGNTSVLNAFMQLLTDRKIHKYNLPEGWLIVSAVNPENEMNDVNTMDTALKDRFEIFNVTYDKKSFLDYIRQANWDRYVTMFIESGLWNYTLPEEVSTTIDGAKYISPRTLEKLNTARLAGFKDEVDENGKVVVTAEEQEYTVYTAILGAMYGRTFFNFIHKEYPILVSDLKRDKKGSLRMLEKYSEKTNYKASYISLTIKSIVDEKIDDLDLVADVILHIPADQAMTLINELSFVLKKNLLDVFRKEYPKVQRHISDQLA